MTGGKPSNLPSVQPKPEFGRACKIINSNLRSKKLTVPFLCEKLLISRATLYRLFADVGGVHAYIRLQRIERVQRDLDRHGSAAKLGDLARHWQFSDPSHLSRVFRETYGVTPVSTRTKVKAKPDPE